MQQSKVRFGDQESIETQKLYYNVLISQFILKLCECEVILNKSVKSTKLISDPAIKSKTKTKLILNQLLFNNKTQTFPVHRLQAIQYFKVWYLLLILWSLCNNIICFVLFNTKQETKKRKYGNVAEEDKTTFGLFVRNRSILT